MAILHSTISHSPLQCVTMWLSSGNTVWSEVMCVLLPGHALKRNRHVLPSSFLFPSGWDAAMMVGPEAANLNPEMKVICWSLQSHMTRTTYAWTSMWQKIKFYIEASVLGNCYSSLDRNLTYKIYTFGKVSNRKDKLIEKKELRKQTIYRIGDNYFKRTHS